MSGVEIRVRSDSRQARRDLSQLENSVKNIETRTARATSAFRKMAIGIGAALAGGAVVKGVNRASDSLVNLENRIALVTGRGKALDKTMNDLFKIAKRTRGDIGGSAETFNRFGIALKGSGKSAEEILRAVESVNKAVAISGSGAESARAALFQLGQGLASGQLRGQELNSVLEQAPRLAGAIADEMGKPLGALRKLAEQGEVTTDVVFNALINQAGQLSKEFETMEGTSEQAFSVMKDQIGRVTGEISAALNITGAFTQRFNAISDSLEKNRVSIVSGVVGSVQSIGSIFKGIGDTIRGIVAILGTAVVYVRDLSIFGNKIDINFAKPELLERASKSMGNIIGFLKDAKGDTRFVTRAMDNMAKSITNAFDTLKDFKLTALEKIVNLSKLASENIKDLYTEGKKFAALKYLQLRGGDGVIKDYITYVKILRAQRDAEKSAERLFKNTADFATKYLSKAWKSIKTFLNLIERKFYWVYDEVIQNSWWTDTMEQTYYLAEKWLGKASDSVSRFGDKVNEKFRGVFASFKSGSEVFRDAFTLKEVKIKFSKATASFSSLTENVATSVSTGLRTAFDTLGSISPILSASFGAALVAGVTKFLSPSLFKKTFGKIGPLAFVALFAGLASGLSAQLVDSGIFKQLGANLGTTLAVAFDAFIDLIPAGVDAAIQSLSSLGKAFGKQLEGSIIGLPAKILSFLPGGGLLTTILYGGGGFLAIGSIFSKNIRGLIVKTVASSAALTSATGVMGNILFGTLGAKKGLGILAATTTASIALFGDLVGTEVSSILGIISGIMVTSMLSGRGAMAVLGGSFSGLRTMITTGALAISSTMTAAFRAISISGLTTFRGLTAQSTLTTGIMSKQFLGLSGTIGRVFTALSTGRGRILGIGIAAVAATAALTGAANAAGDLGQTVDGGIFSADNLFYGLTVASILPLIWKPLKAVSKTIGKRLGLGIAAGAARAIGVGLLSAVTAIFSPFVAAFAAVAATATLAYVAIFGTESSFMEMIGKTLTKVKRLFGLTFDNDLKIGIDTKREARGLRNRQVGGLDKRVVDTLQRLDFGNLSQKNAFAITTSVKSVSKLTEKANSERLRYGKVSIATAEALRVAQDETTRAVREGANNENSSAENVSAGLSQNQRNLSVGVEGTGFIANSIANVGIGLIKGLDNIRRAFGKSTSGLAERLEVATAIGEADLDDPKQFKAIIGQLFTSGAFETGLPKSVRDNDELMDALEGVAIGVIEPSPQLTQSLLTAIEKGRQSDAGIFSTIVESTLKALGIKDLTATQKAISNALTAFNDEGRQQLIISNVKELDNVVNALSQAGANVSDSFALINETERALISGLVERQKVEAKNLEDAKSQRFQAESAEEISAAIAKGEEAQTELARLTFKLEKAVRESIMTGVENTDFAYITKALGEAGISERVSELIAEGLSGALDGFDPSILGKNLEKLNLGAILGNNAGLEFSAKPEDVRASFIALQSEKGLLEKLEAKSGDLSNKEKKRYVELQKSVKSLTKDVQLYASFIDGIDVTDDELPNLISSVASLSSIDNLDLDKFFKIEPDTLKEVAQLASIIDLVKNTKPGDLVSLGLGDYGVDIGGAEQVIDTLKAKIDETLGGFGNSIRTGFLSDFEEIAQETGLSFNEIARLGVKANTKIRGSIETIANAQKALNKLSVGDTEQRAEQLRLIKEAEGSINRQLMGGTIASLKTGLERQGVDSGLATESPEAMGIGLNIASLQRELNGLNATDIAQRDIILGKIKEQERLLNGITEGARSNAEAVRDSIKSSLGEVLRGTMSVKDGIMGVLNTLSNQIIDTVVGSFVDAMFQTSGLEDMFGGLFEGLFSQGDDAGKKLGASLSDGISSAFGEGGGLSGIMDTIGGLFGGGSGGGLGGILSTVGGFFGFGMAQGGTVPSTPFSQVGKDSVPTMLMPGEVVMSKNAVRNNSLNNGSQQATFNINVQGDVSRQTRKEIVAMMPQIAGGVNAQNKENNFKR